MSDTEPMVSIITPCYNRSDLISETIESILDQSYPYWELIIVDDHSSDDSWEVINTYREKDNRIKVFKNTPNKKGASVARNEGINQAKGEFLIFLDSDDVLHPNCLERRVLFMCNNSDLDFAVFQTGEFYNNSGDTDIYINVLKNDTPHLYRFLSFDIPWLTTGPIWKKSSFIKMGSWKEELPSWQDWELHLRAVILGLRYDCIDVLDNYWRKPHNTSIGLNSRSAAHIRSHEHLLGFVEDLAKEKNRFTETFKSSIIKLYFFLSKEWMKKGEMNQAEQCWSIPFERGLLSEKEFRRGLSFIRKNKYFHKKSMAEFGLLNRILNKLYSMYVPSEFVMKSSGTFHKYKGE